MNQRYFNVPAFRKYANALLLGREFDEQELARDIILASDRLEEFRLEYECEMPKFDTTEVQKTGSDGAPTVPRSYEKASWRRIRDTSTDESDDGGV